MLEVKQLTDLDDREQAMLMAAVVKFMPIYRSDTRSAVNKLTWASRLIGKPRGVPIAATTARELFARVAAAGTETRCRAVLSLN